MTDATMNGDEEKREAVHRQEPTRSQQPVGDETDEKCDEVLADAVEEKPGIYHVDFDPEHGEVSFAYDPRLVGEDDVERVAQEVAPTLQDRWATCTMRLDRRGGRGCEACALALEDRLHQIPGVRRATVSYMGGAMSIAYDDQLLSPDDLWREVRAQGVDARPSGALRRPEPAPEEGLGARLRALLSSDRVELAFTVITLLGMVTGFVAERAGASPTLVMAAYVAAYVTGGAFGLQASLQSLRDLTIDVDLLMILAAVGAALVGAPFEGAMLLFLFSLSNVLQNYALDRTRNAIRSLMELRPEEALVRRGEELVTLPIEEIDVDDRIVVRPGERIALDGIVVEGESSVDQSSITGESMPVRREDGDRVLAGTINQKGSLEVSVTHLAKESTIAKLIQLVEEAHSEKAPTQRFIDRAEQYYAVGVLVLTGLAIVVPIFLLQEAFQPAFYRAMTLMVAASPCALVISTPATVLSAIGNGARRGVLFKGGVYVEQAAEIKVVAFDKTGTLTRGEPQVTDVVSLNKVTEDEVLRLAAAVEARSEHLLAQAITDAAEARGIEWPEVDAFQSDTGRGVAGRVNGHMIAVGNNRFFDEYEVLDGESDRDDAQNRLDASFEALQSEGKTAVMVARIEGQQAHVMGLIAIADVLRPEAADVVKALKERGVERVVMLTGDNERVARAIAAEAGVDA
ncbi:MAG: heavy metal translocating P-type ATPase, partial [Chloroflexota bacterium]